MIEFNDSHFEREVILSARRPVVAWRTRARRVGW
jgi:hypothetical protein